MTAKQERGASLPLSFWAKVEKTSGCWNWTAATSDGYGQFGAHGERLAHRLTYIAQNGPVVAGLYVLHRCDNRRCVNPAHLFLGDHAANMADMVAKGRVRNRGAMQWATGRCIRGHDVTDPANVVTITWSGPPKRRCRLCRNLLAREARAAQSERSPSPTPESR